MKILLAMQQPYFPAVGGANKCNRALAEALVKKNHTVQAVVQAVNASSHLTYAEFRNELERRKVRVRSGAGIDTFSLDGVEVHALSDLSQMRDYVMKQSDTFAPDWILVSCEEWSQNLLDGALKAAPSRVIYLVHTLLFLPFGPQAFFPSRSRSKLLEEVAGIVAVGEFVNEYINEWSGLDSTVFHWPAYGSRPFPDYGKFDDGFITLVNPSKGKGIDVFVALARRLPQVQFAAVPTWGTTQEDRLILGSLPNVRLLEPSEDFDQILKQTRILLMPSLWQEAFPLTVIEAMLRGIPVLASNTGGLPEAKLGTDFVLPVQPIERFTEQLDDRLIPIPVVPEQITGDLDQWCEALRLLISDRSFYEKHSAAARQSALRFVSGLSFDPFENLLFRSAKEHNDRRVRSPVKSKVLEPSICIEKVDDLSTRLDALTPEQRCLLLQWLEPKRIEETSGEEQGLSAPPILPVSGSKDLPLSFAQQRLWFLDQYEPNSSVYNIASALRLRGSLNIGALEQSLNEILRRHESLRTTFSMVEGEAVQVIAPSVGLSLAVVDLRDHPAGEREEEARQFANEEGRQPFDLARGPLFRSQLVRLGEDDHELLLTMHHIVSDGWSMGVLHRELSVLYEAFSHSQSSPLPELPIQYADYAVWQREWLQGEVLDRQLSYWKKQLEGIAAVLDLPTDRPRSAVQSHRGGVQSLVLSKDLSEGLKVLSRKEGVTLFMTLLAAFQTLLYRYTGQEDIVVGSPIAGRNRAEIEGLIGFFVNTLVLRTSFAGNLTFKELLFRVRETALAAYAHQDLPFEKLVEQMHQERSLSHSPLFQVMFVLQNAPNAALTFEGLNASPVRLAAETAKFDLTLSMSETREGMRGSLQYSTDLFDDETIARMIGHLQTLLQGIVASPDQRISRLPILTEAEQNQLLIEWNDTKREYPEDKCLHQLFEEQVEKTPDAIAVTFEDQQLTYRELNVRANQLAHYLIQQGVGPEVLVGICMERSLEMVVGILAILKAGGAYVPLDPDYPKERLDFIIQDTRVPVLLTQRRVMERLIEGGISKTQDRDPRFSIPVLSPSASLRINSVEGLDSQAKAVCLDTDSKKFIHESTENPQSEATADNLAYVIYTSGSTGRPKGVAIEHRSALALLSWAKTVYRAEEIAGILASTSICFDLSVFELFCPLASGGQVIMVKDALGLSDLPPDAGVTLVNTVPSAIAELLRADRGIPASVRTVNLAGEPLSHALVHQLYQQETIQRVFDLYGPSEATTYSTYALRQSGGPATIGRPIANTHIYILDSSLQPVPLGIPGELHIGGAGLARGYLSRAELTAEKFIPNPFSTESGTRLYGTGDLARYLPDGNIEFLGRIDHQVKIRGFRIELGEIEVILSQHPAVREAVVLAREEFDNPNSETCTEPSRSIHNPKSPDPSAPLRADKRLVAYIVPRQEGAPTINELRSFVKGKLPEYMVPSAFVFLEGLPLTPNGKIDRKALPTPDQSRPELEDVYVAPRTPAEEIIAEIWAAVLKVNTVGVYDNFFSFGGHSLLATQVVSRIGQAFKVEIPLRALFEGPTVADLAKSIDVAQWEGQGLSAPPILPVSGSKDLPLSFAQQRLWFLDQYEPNSSVYNIASALRLRGSLNIGALEQSLNEILRRHESLRTTFSMVEGEAVQVIAPSVGLSLAVVDLRDHPAGEREEEARQFANEEGRQPFDLARGPLFRSQLVRLGEDDHELLLTMHHIVSDGWSMGVLHRELSVLYEAFSHSQSSPLPELPIQYADYAVWQREWLQGEVLDRQLSYWKKQLEGIAAVLDLPTDRPRSAVQSHRGGVQSLVLSKDLSEGLKVLSRKEGVTLFMTLLAAFQTLLYRYTGQEDIVVGSPIAGRNRAEIEGLIGFFVNTLVLRTSFAGNLTFKELLFRVRETALAAYAHQDLPFEKLVKEIHLQRSLNHTPLFQVLFNMTDEENSKLDLLGLGVECVSTFNPESKFDLTLYVRKQNDEIRFNLVYRVDLFEDARMTCFLQQYRYLLEQVVAAPQDSIQSYSLVTPESRELLPDPSAVLAEPPQQPVTSIFLSWAKRMPANPAISQGGQNWTYSELAERAQTLARVLRTSGLKQRDVVAVYGRRSFGLITGMIGTLLSGAVLMPIDHTLPSQRKRLMLKEAGAKILLCVGDERFDDAALEKDIASSTLVVDPGKGSVVDAEAGQNLEWVSLPELLPNDPSYIFFTSGTTGIPKGVLGCHKGLSHFLAWQRDTFAIGPGDRAAQLTGLSFDAVLRDIFLPLTSGATLCLPDADAPPAAEATVAWLEREKITVMHAVPSLAQSWLVNGGGNRDLGSMRWVFFVGESLTDALVHRWRMAFCNPGEIVNLYGPTETTLIRCFYRVPADLRPGVQPVGWPITDTQALVLAGNKRLCGINEPGEIVLRTPFRSLGYVNVPEENQKRFVKNPFRNDAQDLIYLTADAGRYAPDGTLEILGRLDDQIKIHGVRIEPAEVTAILARHPGVESCIVVGRKDKGAETVLVAYVVASKQEQPTSTNLRSYLLEHLPAMMVPSVFVLLDSLPLTPNGKVDRKALPAPDRNRPESQENYVAPRSPVEEIIAEIWEEVLKVEKVGIHDNFFDLGGHSLLATKVLSRVREAFRVDLALRVLFEAPTVGELALRVEQSISNAGEVAEFAHSLTEIESLSDYEIERQLHANRNV